MAPAAQVHSQQDVALRWALVGESARLSGADPLGYLRAGAGADCSAQKAALGAPLLHLQGGWAAQRTLPAGQWAQQGSPARCVAPSCLEVALKLAKAAGAQRGDPRSAETSLQSAERALAPSCCHSPAAPPVAAGSWLAQALAQRLQERASPPETGSCQGLQCLLLPHALWLPASMAWVARQRSQGTGTLLSSGWCSRCPLSP